MKYVALLRGIGPGNPNMRNDKLRIPFEKLGFSNVQTVISSGNVLFETDQTNIQTLEKNIEEAIQLELGFTSSTIIKSHSELAELIKVNPFKGLSHGSSSYLLITFFKNSTDVGFTTPYQPDGKTYDFIYATDTFLCSVTDNTVVKTTDLMTWMEKKFSKQITSRTWNTMQKIYSKM